MQPVVTQSYLTCLKKNYFLPSKYETLKAIIQTIQRRYVQWFPVGKVLLVGLLMLGIYYQINRNNNLTTIFNEFLSSIRERDASYLCLALGLVPINLAFETLKWLQFTRFFCNMSFRRAYGAVLAGTSFAIFTPNRVGAYGGRWLLAKANQRSGIIVSMLLSSYCQWIVLFLGGLVGFSWFAFNHLQWQLYLMLVLIMTGVVVSLILLLLFWQIGRVLPIIGKCGFKKWERRWLRHLIMLRSMSLKVQLQALQWAALRFVTYSFQYWLLLQFFGIKVTLWEGLAGIWSIFLIQMGVPLSSGLALLARGEIAVFVWRHFGANELSVLSATFGLFVINLVLPALFGAILLLKRNDLKSLNYEKNIA